MWKLISSLVKNNSTSPGTRRRGSLRSAQPSQDFLLGRAGALAGLPGTPPRGGRGQRGGGLGPCGGLGGPRGAGRGLWGRGCAGAGGLRAAGGVWGRVASGPCGRHTGPGERDAPGEGPRRGGAEWRPARPACFPGGQPGLGRVGPGVGRGGRSLSRPGAPGRPSCERELAPKVP